MPEGNASYRKIDGKPTTKMFEGWWTAYGFSGLWISFGVLIWMILRDRRRSRERREQAARRIMEEVLGPGKPSVEDLEKKHGKSG